MRADMQVRVRGVHLVVGEELRSFVELHVERVLQRIFQQQPVEVEVHLVGTNPAKGGVDKEARLTLSVPGLPPLHVKAASDEVRKAVLLGCEKLEAAAKRWLDKHHHHAGGPALADLPEEKP